MTVRCVTLMENDPTPQSDMLSEHGLSILVETEFGRILLDTGASDKLLQNAHRLGVDLSGIDHIVLSHAHYDHTGGLIAVLRQMDRPPQVWFSEYFHRQKFRLGDAGRRYIGAPFSLDELAIHGGIPQRVGTMPVEILPGAFLLGGFHSEETFETIPDFFVYRDHDRTLPDPFMDEIALALQTKNGLLVFLGCAHPGVVSMTAQISRRLGSPVHTLIGGTHLKDADEQRIAWTIRKLESMGIQRVGVSHCTGEKAVSMIQEAFGERSFRNNAGTILEL